MGISVNVVEPVPFHADAKRLWVVLHNLIFNAIRYAARGRKRSWSQETLIAGATESRITGTGSGLGTGPEHLPRGFKMVYRATDPSLGLYIVQTLGGTLSIDSVPEAGTSFTVCVPNGNC